jgi:adenosine deaminase
MTTLTREEIAAWPKAELHVHLDGSVRMGTLLELALERGRTDVLPADDLAGLERSLVRVDESGSLEGYLAWFRHSVPLLQDREALRRAAYELAEDAAAENVRYIEVRYSPILHVEQGLKMDEVNDAVLEGLAGAGRDFGIRSGVIICALRGRHAAASVELADLAVSYRDRGVVGFDLAGPEAGYPAKHHLQAFYHARNSLLALTIHAGESWGPESIHQALFYAGTHRIGHGITLAQDPDLMRYVVNHRIALEVCPTSNVQTRVVPGFEGHPIRQLADAGVAVTVNTDNRLFSRTSLTEELWRVHTRCGLSADQVRTAAVDAFRYGFLPWEEKQVLVREAKRSILGTEADA